VAASALACDILPVTIKTAEVGRSRKAAREYLWHMCATVDTAEAYNFWRRQFWTELVSYRRQLRLRMAFSRDWSKLGKYLSDGVACHSYCMLLDLGGVLCRLGLPGTRTLSDIAVRGITKRL